MSSRHAPALSAEQLQTYLDAGFNRVPVVREVLADLDTPLSAYRKLADGPYTYLFESVQGGERWGRDSIIGLLAREVIRVFAQRIEGTNALGAQAHSGGPLAFIEQFRVQSRATEIECLQRFNGGLVG